MPAVCHLRQVIGRLAFSRFLPKFFMSGRRGRGRGRGGGTSRGVAAASPPPDASPAARTRSKSIVPAPVSRGALGGATPSSGKPKTTASTSAPVSPSKSASITVQDPSASIWAQMFAQRRPAAAAEPESATASKRPADAESVEPDDDDSGSESEEIEAPPSKKLKSTDAPATVTFVPPAGFLESCKTRGFESIYTFKPSDLASRDLDKKDAYLFRKPLLPTSFVAGEQELLVAQLVIKSFDAFMPRLEAILGRFASVGFFGPPYTVLISILVSLSHLLVSFSSFRFVSFVIFVTDPVFRPFVESAG